MHAGGFDLNILAGYTFWCQIIVSQDGYERNCSKDMTILLDGLS